MKKIFLAVGLFLLVLYIVGCGKTTTEVDQLSIDATYYSEDGKIVFTISTNNSVSNYYWDFGDGTIIQNGTNTETHYYTKIGTYEVTVKLVYTDGTTEIAHTTRYINVIKPIVTITTDKTTGPAPLTVTFTVSIINPDGYPLTYTWLFDNLSSQITGTYNGEFTVSYTFRYGGYEAQYSVDDHHGGNVVKWIRIEATQ